MIIPPTVSIQSISLPNADTSAGPVASNMHNLSADFADSLDLRVPKRACEIPHAG